MFRFIFTIIFTIIITSYIMQKPLQTYLGQKYNDDFGLTKLTQNPLFKKGDEFYSYLKVKFKNENLKLSDENTTEQASKPLQEISNEKTAEILAIKLDTNKTEQSTSKISTIQIDTNNTKQDEILVSIPDEINLKIGDEVLFIGDSIMRNIAIASKKFLATKEIKAIDISKHSTGLINKNYYDWKSASNEALRSNKNIKLMVVLFGANDTWGRTIDGKYRDFNTTKWTALYQKRIQEIYDVAKNNKTDVLWLGVPCMKKSDFDDKMATLNIIFENSAKLHNKNYINTKEIICPQQTYATHITNDNNKSIKVREGDGIHLNYEGGKAVAKKILSKIRIDENSTK
ncbi:hypothetical protein LMG7974_00737 [Campylobacter majalis]|uniref:DUF459 domain-containing protein n=1 Tax=Campylobacter majalis TaxID=2790656 RepID=A0ABN7K7C0_9BACT|nr:DUF459 domain-containing protein [Campylobacter majalis]CAD7287849.1 hypothetical protein LMG7974_00737 [Campylobacter majalis]